LPFRKKEKNMSKSAWNIITPSLIAGASLVLIAMIVNSYIPKPTNEVISSNPCKTEFGTIQNASFAMFEDKKNIPSLEWHEVDQHGVNGQALLILCGGAENLPQGYFLYQDEDNIVRLGHRNQEGAPAENQPLVGVKGSNKEFGFIIKNYPEDHVKRGNFLESPSNQALDITIPLEFTKQSTMKMITLKPGDQWTPNSGVEKIK
jgi:hypothetical protein